MKKKIITIVLIGSFFLCGCGSTLDEADNSETKINLNIKCEDLASVDEKDAEAWMDTPSNVCSVDDGAYIAQGLDTGDFLYYYDYDAKKYTKVCNKPECSHSDETCNAFLPGAMVGDGELYDTSLIQKYDDAIYIGGLDDKKACIYKVTCDGSERGKVIDLFDAEISTSKDGGATFAEYNSFKFCIHRGYVYYSIDNGQNSSLFRKKLDGSSKSEETIVSIDEQNDVYRLEPYGRYVFFQKGKYNEDYSDITTTLYAYDTEKNEVVDVKDDIINVYVIRDDKLYYEVVGEGIYEYSLKDGTESLVVSTKDACYNIYKTADKYITMSMEGLRVYDENGNEIYHIGQDECRELKYVSDSRLITGAMNEDGRMEYTFVNNVQDDPDQWDCNTFVFE